MKICLNQNIITLSEAFHNGDLSLADYRLQRRKELEALNNHSQVPLKQTSGLSKVVIKRTVVGTFAVISLLFATVMIAKFIL